MAKHVWLRNRFADNTIAQARVVLKKGIEYGFKFEAALRWLGYIMECQAQNSGGRQLHSKRFTKGVGFQVLKYYWLDDILEGLTKSGHRYAHGRNRDNYLLAGKKLLQAMAPQFGLTTEAPPEAVWDKMVS